MRAFATNLPLLLIFLVLRSGVWAADPEKSELTPSPSDIERDETAGYADPRNASSLPERKAYRQYMVEVSELLKARKFEELNRIYAELLQSKSRLPTGHPKLPAYYAGITSWRICPPNERPLALFKLLREWREKYPDVLAPVVAEAIVQHDYAWQARGTGYASSVSEEGAKRYEERLVKTRELLREALAVKGADPHLHVVVMNVARSSGTPVSKMREQLDKAVAIDPDYIPAYESLAFSLLPRWYGAPGDLEAFLDESVERTKEKWGQGLYAILADSSNKEGDKIFEKTNVSWDRMKAGFDDLRQRFPEVMIYPNVCAVYALRADDRETAKQMFDIIGERFDGAVWGAAITFDRKRKYAIEGETRPPGQVLLDLTTYVYGLRFHPQSGQLYTGVIRRDLLGWDPQTGESIEPMKTGRRIPHKFDFSRNGEFLAIATPEGDVFLRSIADDQDITTAKLGNPLFNLRCSADGAFVVGVRQTEPTAYVLEAQSQKVHQFPIGSGVVTSMELSPDGTVLATGSANKELCIWSLPGGRQLKSVPNFSFVVASLAFSPDGKTLAVGHAGGKRRPPRGMISFYDTSTWEKTADIPAHATYVKCLCYSNDGKLLATAGYGGQLKLWDVPGYKLRGTMKEHLKEINELAFSPDGKRVATTSSDLTTRISSVDQPPLNGVDIAK